jgi:alpha-galactosidase
MFARLNRLILFVSIVTMPLAFRVLPASAQSASDLLTPKAPATPRINGPKVYGVKPGHPFLYRIPCTGSRPMHFSAKGLPPSLKLDPTTGVISGQAPTGPKEYPVTFEATNSLGKFSRAFKVVVGNTLSLTPQMGWNDWYSYYEHPTDTDIREAADAMISSGMADFGYQYVDIDDAWEHKPGSTIPELMGPPRSQQGTILTNGKFPDMNKLTDYIHSLGLKAGIYSGPGPLTCAKFEASLGHEEADAQQFAQCGFDLLKYDWCSYGSIVKDKTLLSLKQPYEKMSSSLLKQDRDIVFNMCQYGQGEVWKWGREVGGTSWRTTGDLGLAKDEALPGFYSIAFANAALGDYAGPGGWNDPDYILIGSVGDAHNITAPAKPTPLTHDEQYSYMSMWALMASPLFFSGQMTKLDAFTLNILCNSEVIDIDQDTLGKQAKIIRQTPDEFVLAKVLEDGSMAVGLLNLSTQSREISLPWRDVGKSGALAVRDVWRQKDLGRYQDGYKTVIAAHGVALIRLIRTK